MSDTPHPSVETPRLLFEHRLKALRLPTMLREYDRVQCADDDIDYPRYLLRMTELEMLDRERRATEPRIRQASSPSRGSNAAFSRTCRPRLRAEADGITRLQRNSTNSLATSSPEEDKLTVSHAAKCSASRLRPGGRRA